MYVRNIYKYYVGYKLVEEAREASRKARELPAPATSKEATHLMGGTRDGGAHGGSPAWDETRGFREA